MCNESANSKTYCYSKVSEDIGALHVAFFSFIHCLNKLIRPFRHGPVRVLDFLIISLFFLFDKMIAMIAILK